jgi:hypothetical protein
MGKAKLREISITYGQLVKHYTPVVISVGVRRILGSLFLMEPVHMPVKGFEAETSSVLAKALGLNAARFQ